MTARLFTPREANTVLADVRPVAERLVALRRRLRELESAQRGVVTAIGGNGSGYVAGDLNAAREEFSTRVAEVDACLRQLDELGVLLKDPDTGLLDFPSRRGDDDVLLCWHVDEDAVDYWHGVDDGFRGRKPIDWDE